MAVDPNAIVARIRQELARRILRAGLTLQSAHRDDLSVGNPSPHATPAPRGDYPRLRTGNLRANVVLSTYAPGDVERTLSLAIGYRPAGTYGLYLAAAGWKGLLDTYAREKGRIDALLQGAP